MRVRLRCLALLLVTSSPVWAQTEATSEVERARQHYERGYALTEAHDYLAAAVEFERAYRASPHYSVLYNLGQAYAMAGRHAAAVQALERFLEQGGAAIPASLAARAQTTLEASRARVGRLALRLVPADAAVFIDGAELPSEARAGEQVLDSGAHGVWLSAPGYEPRYEVVALEPGERRELVAELAPVKRSPALPAAPSRTDQGSSATRTLSYALAGGGLALAAGAVVIALQTNADNEAWRARRDRFAQSHQEGVASAARRAEMASLLDEAARQQRMDDLALGLGVGAALSLGAGAYLFWRSAPGSAGTALSFDGRRVAWSTSW